MTKQSWYEKLPKDQQETLRQWVLDVNTPYTEIARTYGVNCSDISNYAKRTGIPPRKPRRPLGEKKRHDTSTLKGVEAELAEAAKAQEALKQRMEELRARRAELQVRFERDGDELLVHGIGDRPFRADHNSWLNFLNVEGGRRLREFVTAEWRKR